MWKENLYQPVEILLREHDTFPKWLIFWKVPEVLLSIP